MSVDYLFSASILNLSRTCTFDISAGHSVGQFVAFRLNMWIVWRIMLHAKHDGSSRYPRKVEGYQLKDTLDEYCHI